MPEYQRQTIEARRARRWGGTAALGGLAFTAAFFFGYANTTSSSPQACDTPRPTEACTTVHQEESGWLTMAAYSGAVAVAGSIAYLGANALDRRILVLRHAQRIEYESRNAGTSDVADYMLRMPDAPPEGDYDEDY